MDMNPEAHVSPSEREGLVRNKRDFIWIEGVLRVGMPSTLIGTLVSDFFMFHHLQNGRWLWFLMSLMIAALFVGVAGGYLWGLMMWHTAKELKSRFRK